MFDIVYRGLFGSEANKGQAMEKGASCSAIELY
jgi:hypothetical protein